MKSHLFLTLPLISCFAFVSCFPVPKEGPNKKPKEEANTTLTSDEQQKIEEQREKMRLEELAKEAELKKPEPLPTNQTQNTITDPPVVKGKADYPFGTPVPGKEGFVFSPYNNKLLDVRGIASGTLVQDTTYPPSEKKYFRVP
jgi:hypothetical protein